MSAVKIFFTTLCLLLGVLNPLAPLLLIDGGSFDNNENTVIDEPPINANIDDIIENNSDNIYNINGFLTIELDGYCTVDIPQSHWQLVSSDLNTMTQKYLKYKDNKTRMLMGYVTNLDKETDIPGYIVQQAADVDMVTNNKQEVEYNNETWTVVSSSSPIDNSNVEVYYKLDKNGTSAFWMRLTKDLDLTDKYEEEFTEVLNKIINSYNMYYIGGNIFETPTDGIYNELGIGEKDTGEYKENNDNNTVFQGRGGFIKDTNISDNWTDMEIIIDDNKFKLPCSMDDFYNAGYSIHETNINGETVVPVSTTLSFKISNINGTVVEITVSNDSTDTIKTVNECLVKALLIDSNEFISVSEAINQATEQQQVEQQVKQQVEQQVEQPTEGGIPLEEYERDENGIIAELENGIEGLEITDGTNKTQNETNNNKDDSSESESSTIANNNLNTQHKLILAGGITWDIYTDDLKEYYGACTTTKYDSNTLNLIYKNNNYYMVIRIGNLKTITSVYISTIGE